MLTVAQLREHVATDLPDTALTRLLDAAYADIERVVGPPGQRTEVFSPSGRWILLPAAATVTAVREDLDGAPVDLDPTDWRLRGQLLERLATGAHPRTAWLGSVRVTYSLDDEALRDRVAIALVMLDVAARPGLESQQIGDWRETYAPDVAAARAQILAEITQPLALS